jgi:hypothetical protein
MAKLKAPEVKRPFVLMNKPTVKRPQFSMDLPALKKKRQTVIGGAGSSRCFFCGALVSSRSSVCTACGSTVISPDIIMDKNDVKRRMKFLNIKKGYEGT